MQDPYSEFQRIFSKFSSAERVTGAEPDSEDEEDDDATARDGEGAAVKVPNIRSFVTDWPNIMMAQSSFGTQGAAAALVVWEGRSNNRPCNPHCAVLSWLRASTRACCCTKSCYHHFCTYRLLLRVDSDE